MPEESKGIVKVVGDSCFNCIHEQIHGRIHWLLETQTASWQLNRPHIHERCETILPISKGESTSSSVWETEKTHRSSRARLAVHHPRIFICFAQCAVS